MKNMKTSIIALQGLELTGYCPTLLHVALKDKKGGIRKAYMEVEDLTQCRMHCPCNSLFVESVFNATPKPKPAPRMITPRKFVL